MLEIVRLIRACDSHAFERELERAPELALKAQVVVDAARMGRLRMLEALDRCGADWNSRWRGYRPLHALIQEEPHGPEHEPVTSERIRALRFLLRRGADPESLGAFPPASALVIAAFSGRQRLVEALLAHGAIVDEFAASALGDDGRVRRALGRVGTMARSRAPGGLTALQCCAGSRLGRENTGVAAALCRIAGLLLGAGADPNARTLAWDHEVDVQYFAISAGNLDMVRLLFDAGADPTEALRTAVWQKDMRCAEMALERGAEIDAPRDGRPVLNELILWGRVKAALWLLERGADPNVPDSRGWTAVHQAASRGNARMFRALRERGGDLAAKDSAGRSPEQLARDAGTAAKLGLGRVRNPLARSAKES